MHLDHEEIKADVLMEVSRNGGAKSVETSAERMTFSR
jgi:hypothetical protein